MTVFAVQPPSISELVNKFDALKDDYRAADEARVRRELIDPLFANLGWDVNNLRRLSGAQLEVIHEDRAGVTVDGQRKYPDYCFRLSNARKFFVEAKRPATSLKSDRDAAFQIRRYGWSAGLPFNVVTNFEEFVIYDCRQEPTRKDPPETGRLLYLRCQEYVEKWDEIASWFSRAAVAEGSLDRKIERFKIARGAKTVDASFLERMSRWRQVLARCIAEKNPALTQRQLNYVVQMTIDRIVFLRICEDRDIEPYQRLHSLTQGDTVNVYPRLCRMFREADDRYNSGLFHFTPERERDEKPDSLSFSISIPDKALEDIIKDLYPPYSPYAFSVMPAEILGRVYEQFLGSVIRVASNREVFVEEKPEVRKAGGVYYTPAYIVDYIVKNTVGKLLEGKTLKQAAKLRILDPACGSGSFLIGAYQFLLDWHLQRHVEEASGSRRRAPIEQTADGDWRLTVEEKKRILLTHIFGVDIDVQAVEVAKLSLLLKTLEGETRDTIDAQIRLFHERALPDLSRNIKCGNALIGPDFYQAVKFEELTEDDHYRVNVFDWSGKDGFPDIMKSGGFDAVIGNPPYVRIQAMKEWSPLEVEEYKRRYVSASKGNYDIYVVFVEKGLKLLNEKGSLGFILPHKFFNAQYGQPLRNIIAAGKHLSQVIHFGHQQIFTNATTYTCILFLDKTQTEKFHFEQVNNLDAWNHYKKSISGSISTSSLIKNEWNFLIRSESLLFEKLTGTSNTMKDLCQRIAQGIRTSANNVYVLEMVSETDETILAYSERMDRCVTLDRASVSPFLQGKDIKSFQIFNSGKVIIIPYELKNEKISLIEEVDFRKKYPKTYRYLLNNKPILESRECGRMKGNQWHAYVYPKNIEIMRAPKILIPDIANRAAFALDEFGTYAFTSGYGITLKKDVCENVKYILGLLNGKVLDFYLKRVSTPLRGGFFRYFTQFVELLPIRRIDFSDGADVARHDAMVQLVERMINLHKRLQTPLTQQERTVVERQIAATDREIDELTYDLYALTPDERRIIEDATA
jgi:type I restriction-modification system DNA methylase subunit